MFDWYADDVNLDTHIDSAIDVFRQSREDYWRDVSSGRYLELFDTAGSVVFEATKCLLAADTSGRVGVSFELASTLAKPGPFRDLVREKIQTEIAWEFATTTRAMSERCLELVSLLIRTQPDEQVCRFMNRLSRCYIFGFFPESVILCRSVLESAVRELFVRRNVDIESETGRADMRSRLRFATMAKWLSKQAEKEAWEVWQRGNVAIHNDPEAVKDVFGTIAATLRVLNEIYR